MVSIKNELTDNTSLIYNIYNYIDIPVNENLWVQYNEIKEDEDEEYLTYNYWEEDNGHDGYFGG